MEVTSLKCPSCGSVLPFDASVGKWKCASCGSLYSEADILALTKDSDLDITPPEVTPPPVPKDDPYGTQPELSTYRCKNCGAEMVADDTCAATFCVYCGSSSILKGRLEGEFRPKYVIPFSKTKQDALDAYAGLRKGRFLAPKEFGDSANIEKMTAVYIPFWLYKGVSSGSVDGTREELTSWRSGDYVYTKHDVFREYRAGHESFSNVPADGSKKFDDNLMDSIEPFYFDKLLPFNYSYLSGFLAEKYDVGPEEDKSRASLRMNNSLREDIYNTIRGSLQSPQEYFDCDIQSIDYALLPVWMLNVFVDGKAHTFAMNGQTGKCVGDVPVHAGKAWAFFLALLVGMIGVVMLIAHLFFMD